MKYNRSEIMRRAWSLYNMSKQLVSAYAKTFGECLRRAWSEAKDAIKQAAEMAKTGLRRMSYHEYKLNYADCKTVEGSYDKRTKTIEVMTKVGKYGEIKHNHSGLCPIGGTYCYGDCMAH